MDARAWLTHWASLGTDTHRQQLFVALLTEHEALGVKLAEAEQRAEQAEAALQWMLANVPGAADAARARVSEAQSAHGRRDEGT